MPRLFIAIRPPEPVRTQLISLMGGVEGARWQNAEQLHLTLRFIGDVDSRTEDDVIGALDSIRSAAFTIAVSGIGTFDRKGKIDTLWAGATPAAPLAALHKKLDRAVSAYGLPAEQRAYVPHITLARFSRVGTGLPEFFAMNGALSSPPFVIDQFALFESTIGKQGPHYAKIAEFALR